MILSTEIIPAAPEDKDAPFYQYHYYVFLKI